MPDDASETCDYQVRQAHVDDLPEVMRLIHPFVEQQRLLERTEAELLRLIPNGFVAEEQGEMIGFAAVEVYSRKLAEIQCLAVAVSHQRRGLGRQLVQHCVERARQLGILELMAITSSEQLFQSCGFDFSLPHQKKALFITP